MVQTLPKIQTVNTATDAMTHAIEGYTNRWNNPYSDAMAEKAMELIVPSIIEVSMHPDDVNSRNKLHIGASMAGLSFSNSQIGLAHALGYSLGAIFHIAHGKSVGIFLPEVIHFNYNASKEKYNRLNSIIPEKYRKATLDLSMEFILNSIGQSTSISETGISSEMYNKNMESPVTLASESTGIVTNPRDASMEDIKMLFQNAY